MSSLPAKWKCCLLVLAKNLEKQKLNFSRSALFYMKARVSLKYFVHDCSWGFEILNPLLLSVYKLSREIFCRKICMTSFLKRLEAVVGQNECLCRSSHPKGCFKKGVIHKKFTRKHLHQKIRDSSAGVFLWLLRNLLDHFFCRTRPDCFWF